MVLKKHLSAVIIHGHQLVHPFLDELVKSPHVAGILCSVHLQHALSGEDLGRVLDNLDVLIIDA